MNTWTVLPITMCWKNCIRSKDQLQSIHVMGNQFHLCFESVQKWFCRSSLWKNIYICCPFIFFHSLYTRLNHSYIFCLFRSRPHHCIVCGCVWNGLSLYRQHVATAEHKKKIAELVKKRRSGTHVPLKYTTPPDLITLCKERERLSIENK